MIVITVKWNVAPEHAEQWPRIAREFTEATRAEPGCLWYEWSRSVEDPNQYVLIEAFRDGEAGAAHVNSAHFDKAMGELGAYLVDRPKIISFEAPGEGWSELGELRM
ncbi:MAG: putative quinol monooxygenase [Pseudoclavibacter sp.]|nr:putative quinol monooxygenase [Pseudoclavibacter sp.]